MLKLPQPCSLKHILSAAQQELARRMDFIGAAGLSFPIELRGNENIQIENFSSADEAEVGSLSFAVGLDYFLKTVKAKAASVIINPKVADEIKGLHHQISLIICNEPRLLFSIMIDLASPVPKIENAFNESVFADYHSTKLAKNVLIGQGVYIGRNVRIGKNTIIAPKALIEDNVSIGEDCVICSGAILRYGVTVGNRCQIHCGSVIGDDGFGYTQLPAPQLGRLFHVKNKHVGSVIIEDDVEIGANCCIDRGLISNTVIGQGSKIDNLVQIGHNCRIGRDCIVVSQTGIAGHAEIGDRAFLLGQAGIGPGVKIGNDAIITAQAGVGSGNIPAGRNAWSGTPARLQNEFHQTAALAGSQLPKVRRFFNILKKCASFEELKKSFFDNQQDAKK